MEVYIIFLYLLGLLTKVITRYKIKSKVITKYNKI